MKIIQSAWACNKLDLLSTNSGWLAPEYNLMSWALSCLQLKKHYPEVVLYCDDTYKKILIDILQLPYTEIVCNLDILNKYHPQLWALPKIYAYSQQRNPFLHVDGDVFIWKKFNDDLLNGNLIAQNMEAATDYYEKIMISLELKLNYFPEEIRNERKFKRKILAYNAGIFGGKDISFFKEYTSKAFEFVDKNILNLSSINITNFNVFFEQYLFYCLVKKNKKKVNVYISETIGDNQYKGFGDFSKVPYAKDYLHLLGSYKRNEFVCNQLADRLRQDYPVYYYRIIALFKKKEIPLYKDYYHSIEDCEEKYLVNRYNYLKSNFLTKEKFKNSKVTKSKSNKNLDFPFFINESKIIGFDKNQFKDFEIFKSKINKIINNKFRLISRDYLYARDCNSNGYFQYLFEKKENIYTKRLISDDALELISCKYNWSSFIKKNKGNNMNFFELKEMESNMSVLVIPECHEEGVSLINVDFLDIIILSILQTSKTIRELLDELKEYFGEDELENSQVEYEKLILGRIKLGIHIKSIRVVF